MSTFIRLNERTPMTSSNMAVTATESGRRSARRTIHISCAEDRGSGSRSWNGRPRVTHRQRVHFSNYGREPGEARLKSMNGGLRKVSAHGKREIAPSRVSWIADRRNNQGGNSSRGR